MRLASLKAQESVEHNFDHDGDQLTAAKVHCQVCASHTWSWSAIDDNFATATSFGTTRCTKNASKEETKNWNV